jgi:2'-5' RNA ligase
VDLRSWLASASAPEGELVADRIQLMRSHLGRGPARYETLAAMKLGVPAGV